MQWIVTWETIVTYDTFAIGIGKTERTSGSKTFDDRDDAYAHRDSIGACRHVYNVKVERKVSLEDIYDAVTAGSVRSNQRADH